MIELKVYKDVDDYVGYDETPEEMYDKYEANLVIAELEKKLAAAQLVQRLNEPEALYSNLDTMIRLNHERDVVARRERHQKYKRCLAMADKCADTAKRYYYLICLDESNNPKYDRFPKKMDLWEKWHNRWLAIADKFKEE